MLNKNVKVALLGNDSTGKTTIAMRIITDKFNPGTESTIGACYSLKSYEDFKMELWDTAGQERFLSLIPMYYRNADIIILVYDLTKAHTIDKISYYLERLTENNFGKFFVIIVGNKTDLLPPNDDNTDAGHCAEKISDFVSKCPIAHDRIFTINISAKDGYNFDKFNGMITSVGKNVMIERFASSFTDVPISGTPDQVSPACDC